MQDALISPEGIAILTGAEITEASSTKPIFVHATTEIDATGVTFSAGKVKATAIKLPVGVKPTTDPRFGCYVMLKDGDGNFISEPFSSNTADGGAGKVTITEATGNTDTTVASLAIAESTVIPGLPTTAKASDYTLFIDYYEKKENSGTFQIDITPDKFGGYFYVEASTLFRNQATGQDDPAEFIIPNAKVQSNFTFSMASSGDPSAFDFTLDAFPGRVKGTTKDVLAAIQVVANSGSVAATQRPKTDADDTTVVGG